MVHWSSTQYYNVQSSMWLPQGGALKIENLQFTQYSIIMLLSSMLHLLLTAELQLTIIRLHVAIHEECADNHTL